MGSFNQLAVTKSDQVVGRGINVAIALKGNAAKMLSIWVEGEAPADSLGSGR